MTSLILLAVACATIIAIMVEIAVSKAKHHHSSSGGSSSSNSHWDYITCREKSSSSSSASFNSSSTLEDDFFSLGYTSSSDTVDLCTNYVYGEHVGILVLLSLDWFILWIVAFWWYSIDNVMKLKRISKPDTYHWKQYTLFTIKRQVCSTSHGSGSGRKHGWAKYMPSFSAIKIFTGLGGGHGSTHEYSYQLDLETSLKLHYYLARATKMYRRRNAILANPWPTPMYNLPQCKKHPLHEPHHCTCVANVGMGDDCVCTHCVHSTEEIAAGKDRNLKKND